MKPCYADYVKRSLRFFLKHRNDRPLPVPRTEADKANWNACATAFDNLPSHEQSMLDAVYTAGQPLLGAITDYADRHHISADYVWNRVNALERHVAEVRGLI